VVAAQRNLGLRTVARAEVVVHEAIVTINQALQLTATIIAAAPSASAPHAHTGRQRGGDAGAKQVDDAEGARWRSVEQLEMIRTCATTEN
jgi:hypothetical protein